MLQVKGKQEGGSVTGKGVECGGNWGVKDRADPKEDGTKNYMGGYNSMFAQLWDNRTHVRRRKRGNSEC